VAKSASIFFEEEKEEKEDALVRNLIIIIIIILILILILILIILLIILLKGALAGVDDASRDGSCPPCRGLQLEKLGAPLLVHKAAGF